METELKQYSTTLENRTGMLQEILTAPKTKTMMGTGTETQM